MGRKQVQETYKTKKTNVGVVNSNYKAKYGFNVPENAVFKTKKGLNEGVVRQISEMKKEPKWMLDFRLKGLKIFNEKALPEWGGNLKDIDLALIPIGGTYTMNSEEAAKCTETIKPKIAIPMHYGTIVGTLEDAEKFKKLAKCEAKILSKA